MKELRKKIWIDPFQTGLLVRIVVCLVSYQLVTWAFLAFCDQLNAALAQIGTDGSYLQKAPTCPQLCWPFR